MNVTQGSGWAWHAYRAATDRLAIPGRTLDPGFVAGLEVDVIAVARETGEDARDALDGLHEGLAAAVASPCPACGSRGRHSPSCRDPWASTDGRVYPLEEAS